MAYFGKILLILLVLSLSVSPVFAYCGDAYCNITEEDQESCCSDCGCPFYHRCVDSVCVETSGDVGGGLGEEVGRGISSLIIPLGGIVLFLGITIILIASIVGGIKNNKG